jgi:hypothetical protein
MLLHQYYHFVMLYFWLKVILTAGIPTQQARYHITCYSNMWFSENPGIVSILTLSPNSIQILDIIQMSPILKTRCTNPLHSYS